MPRLINLIGNVYGKLTVKELIGKRERLKNTEHGQQYDSVAIAQMEEDLRIMAVEVLKYAIEPSNCKWSTPKEQANNRRKNKKI